MDAREAEIFCFRQAAGGLFFLFLDFPMCLFRLGYTEGMKEVVPERRAYP